MKLETKRRVIFESFYFYDLNNTFKNNGMIQHSDLNTRTINYYEFHFLTYCIFKKFFIILLFFSSHIFLSELINEV